jgi:hypothetical protein
MSPHHLHNKLFHFKTLLSSFIVVHVLYFVLHNIAILALGLRPKQRFAKVQAEKEA